MNGIPRRVLPIYAIVFLDVVGYTFLIPLLPSLAQRYDTSPVVVGALISTTAICATLASPVWGALSDRVGRRLVLIASQAFSLTGYALLAIAPDIAVLFASRAIEGLGGGNLGVAQAFIVDGVAERERDRALAYASAAFGAGFIVGPIASGLLARIAPSAPFWAAAVLEATLILITTLVLRNVKGPVVARNAPHRTREIVRELTIMPLRALMVMPLLYIFAFTYFFTAFALFLDRRLHAGASEASVLLGLAGAIGAAVLVFGVPPLDRRFGAKRVALAAFAVAALAYASLAVVDSVPRFLVVLVLWSASGATLRVTLNTLIASAVAEARRGAILGFADALDNAAMIVTPALGAAVVQASPALAGVIPAACAFVALLAGLTLRSSYGCPMPPPAP